MSDWLAQRTFGEVICLLLCIGAVIGWIIGAIRGRT